MTVPAVTLRVAMIGQRGLPATHGGVERHVEELGAELARRGHEVTVYCRRGYAPTAVPYLRGMRLEHVPTVGTKHLEALVHSFVCTLRAMRSSPDVIHYHAIGPSVLAVIPRFLGFRTAVVATNHGMDQDRAKWGGAAQRALTLAAWLCGRVPQVTMAPSRAIVEHYAMSGTRAAVYVPHGTEPKVRRQPEEMLRRFAIAPGGYFLFVGRLVPEKRIDFLIEVFRRFPGDCQLVIVGGSSYTDDYVARLRQLAGEDPRVLLTGYVYGTLLEELYSNARAFVSASRVEGVPLTILEAASFGVPLVLSDIPGHLQVAGPVDGPGHRIFPEGDADGLFNALSRSLARPQEEQAGARVLRARVLATYNWAEAARVTEEVYVQACEERGRRFRGRPPRA